LCPFDSGPADARNVVGLAILAITANSTATRPLEPRVVSVVRISLHRFLVFFSTGNIDPGSGVVVAEVIVEYGERGLHCSGGGQGCGAALHRRGYTLDLECGMHDIYLPFRVREQGTPRCAQVLPARQAEREEEGEEEEEPEPTQRTRHHAAGP
jgi:hypothetical protein